ncbi:MAG: alpha/beta hydrolase [Pedobacter sp.]|nr:MAG: alpha/beta hydrolase [Pedobacter sp.]
MILNKMIWSNLWMLLIGLPLLCFSQEISNSKLSTTGISFKKDTSFTIHSAYLKTLKTHPEAKIIKNPSPTNILVIKDQTYFLSKLNKLYYNAYLPPIETQDINNYTPAIIIIHGGGWRSGNKEQHESLAHLLAKEGFACFTIDYTLSTHALYPTAYFDVLNAIGHIKKNAQKYNIDPQKLTLLGYSAGGALASLVATKSNTVHGLINIDGVLAFIHPDSGEGDDTKSISAATHWFGINKNEGSEIWKDASALTHVHNFNSPTLFINSGVKRMQAGQMEFIENLISRQIYIVKKEFPNAPHTFALFNPWLSEIVETCVSFLNQIFPKNS